MLRLIVVLAILLACGCDNGRALRKYPPQWEQSVVVSKKKRGDYLQPTGKTLVYIPASWWVGFEFGDEKPTEFQVDKATYSTLNVGDPIWLLYRTGRRERRIYELLPAERKQ